MLAFSAGYAILILCAAYTQCYEFLLLSRLPQARADGLAQQS
jgi:hypothetical protein